MSLQKPLFTIGTTSCIYPDDILPNVHSLKDRVGDIELVLFEVASAKNIPSRKTIKELNDIRKNRSLTYTVHLPLNIDIGSENSDEKAKSLKKIGIIIDRLSILDPYAYILHVNLSESDKKNLENWRDRVSQSLKNIIKLRLAAPHKIAVENLSYPFEYIDGLVIKNGFSICVDIGHLIVMGIDPLKYLKKYFDAIRVIHLHGVNGGKDHVSLKHLDTSLIRNITQFLKRKYYDGVLTLEVFSETDLNESMEALWESLYL